MNAGKPKSPRRLTALPRDIALMRHRYSEADIG